MKFFVIGLGSIGSRHAKNLLDMGHTVWGYDKSLQTALRVKEELPGLEIAADMWGCDAYVICTPPDQHIHEIGNAIGAGKHVFVEKPIGVPADIEPLGKLLEEAKRKNLVVMVGNMLRFHPEVRKVKPLVKKPATPLFEVLQKNERYKENVILNWGAHEIDLALYFSGPAVVTTSRGGEKRAVITLQHFKGARSMILMDYLTEPEVRRFEIDEEDGGWHVVDLRLPDWNDVYMDEMREFEHRIYANQHNLRYESVGAIGDDGLATLKIIAEAMRMADAS